MGNYHRERLEKFDEMVPFGPPPDWYETYWMTDGPVSRRLKLPYAAAASLMALLLAWIA